MRTALFAPLVLFALLLSACSRAPDDTLIRGQITERLLEGTAGRLFIVEGFEKLNGIPRDEHTYIAEVQYDLRFKVGFDTVLKELQRESGSIFSAGAEAMDLGVRYGDFDAGDVIHQRARATFYWTEKGWRLETLKVEEPPR